MANLDLLENSIPVAPLKLAALPGSMEMAKKSRFVSGSVP